MCSRTYSLCYVRIDDDYADQRDCGETIERGADDLSDGLLRRDGAACGRLCYFLSEAKGAETLPKAPEENSEEEVQLTAEERIKNEEHPLNSNYRLLENARSNQAPDKEETYRFKWNGLFYLSPVKDAFMARLRIPGGIVKTYQLRGLAQTAKDLTSGYCQITTRANFQMRLIQPKDAPEVLRPSKPLDFIPAAPELTILET